jgi:hypothetical protein
MWMERSTLSSWVTDAAWQLHNKQQQRVQTLNCMHLPHSNTERQLGKLVELRLVEAAPRSEVVACRRGAERFGLVPDELEHLLAEAA